jgi:hypothetical protein
LESELLLELALYGHLEHLRRTIPTSSGWIVKTTLNASASPIKTNTPMRMTLTGGFPGRKLPMSITRGSLESMLLPFRIGIRR